MISEMGRPFPSLSLSLRWDPERGEPARSCRRQSHHVNRTRTHVYAKVFLSTRNRQYPDFACDCSPQYGNLQLSLPPVEVHHEQKVLEHAVLFRVKEPRLQPCYSLGFLPERTTTATQQAVLVHICCLRPRCGDHTARRAPTWSPPPCMQFGAPLCVVNRSTGSTAVAIVAVLLPFFAVPVIWTVSLPPCGLPVHPCSTARVCAVLLEPDDSVCRKGWSSPLGCSG